LSGSEKSADDWHGEGSSLFDLEKYDRSIEYYDEALKINPTEASWVMKGLCLEKLGKYDEAIKCFEESLKINPKNAKLYQHMSRICLDCKDNNVSAKSKKYAKKAESILKSEDPVEYKKN